MGDQDTRDPAAPLPVAPQATLPHNPAPPWGWPPPPYHPAQPQVDLHKPAATVELAKFVIQVVLALVTVGGIVYAAGLLVGDFRAFKAQITADVGTLKEQGKQTADSAEKANASSGAALLKVDELNAKLERLNLTRKNHARRDEP